MFVHLFRFCCLLQVKAAISYVCQKMYLFRMNINKQKVLTFVFFVYLCGVQLCQN